MQLLLLPAAWAKALGEGILGVSLGRAAMAMHEADVLFLSQEEGAGCQRPDFPGIKGITATRLSCTNFPSKFVKNKAYGTLMDHIIISRHSAM
jgi:hypothetical protein